MYTYINNSNNNDEYIIKIFNSVWNNIYIKKNIFKYLKIYKIFYNCTVDFRSSYEWEVFKSKGYLTKVKLSKQVLSEIVLPENVKCLVFVPPGSEDDYNSEVYIPDSVKEIEMYSTLNYSNFNSILIQSMLSRLTSLKLNVGKDFQLKPNELPPSITDLQLNDQYRREPLFKKNILPSNLKKLSLSSSVTRFEEGSLPSTLQEVKVFNIPSILVPLSSIALTKLYFSSQFSSLVNVKFPETLTYLDIRCFQFDSSLPSGLNWLSLQCSTIANEIKFPSSLESLYLVYINNIEIINHKSATSLKNLKSLKIDCSSLVDSFGEPSIYPLEKLESLTFLRYGKDFNQPLLVNQLPPNLTHLDLGHSYDQTIGVNVLPASLKILCLNHPFNRFINPLSIPPNLKLLDIRNPLYFHPINLTNTHPFTCISIVNSIESFVSSVSSSDQIRVLKLPLRFVDNLSVFHLENKSNLEYLHLGERFNNQIEIDQLPINNNIKTLELSEAFNKTLNLSYFKNLETLFIQLNAPLAFPTITTTINQDGSYNFYNLKEIVIKYHESNGYFFKYLDINFIPFLKKNKITNPIF